MTWRERFETVYETPNPHWKDALIDFIASVEQEARREALEQCVAAILQVKISEWNLSAEAQDALSMATDAIRSLKN